MYPALAAIFFFILIQVLNTKVQQGPETKYLNPPPEHIEHFHFGFKESLADSLWLRWIQDNDHCQTYTKPVQYSLAGPQNPDHSDITSVPRYKICDNSWSFKMLDAITLLSPKFDMPYLAGASTLAILVEDFEGATVIYERGLKEYPTNWQLLYRAAFHFQYNLKNVNRAAELLIAVADNGGPLWARGLASRLYTAGGQLELAIASLETYRKSLDPNNEDGIKMVEKRIVDLRAKLIGLPKSE